MLRNFWGVIVNARAGRGKTLKTLPLFQSVLEEGKTPYRLRITESPLELEEVFEDFRREGVDSIISVGGDGTANSIASSILEKGLPLLVLPFGTGNDYAKSLYGDLPWKEVMDKVKGGEYRERYVDVGVLELKERRKVFLNGMGMGLDGEIVRKITGIPLLGGDLLYLAGLFRALLSYRPTLVKLTTEKGEILKRSLILTIGLGKYLGGGFLLHPKADLTDGLLDISLIENLPNLKLVFKLPLVFKGKHIKEKEVHYFQARNASFSTENPLFLQTDGELHPTPVSEGRINIIERGLKVIVPT